MENCLNGRAKMGSECTAGAFRMFFACGFDAFRAGAGGRPRRRKRRRISRVACAAPSRSRYACRILAYSSQSRHKQDANSCQRFRPLHTSRATRRIACRTSGRMPCRRAAFGSSRNCTTRSSRCAICPQAWNAWLARQPRHGEWRRSRSTSGPLKALARPCLRRCRRTTSASGRSSRGSVRNSVCGGHTLENTDGPPTTWEPTQPEEDFNL